MKGQRALGIGFAVAALAAFGMVATTAHAAPDRLRVASLTIAPGEQGAVGIIAEDLSTPGATSWSVDLTWAEGVVDAVSCASDVSECSTEFASNTGRVTGASSAGLASNTVLAAFTFQCGPDEGTSDLTLTINAWPNEVDIQNGAITCAEEVTPPPEATATPATLSLPPTGAGPANGGGAWLWAAALLSAMGAALIGVWTLRREGA